MEPSASSRCGSGLGYVNGVRETRCGRWWPSGSGAGRFARSGTSPRARARSRETLGAAGLGGGVRRAGGRARWSRGAGRRCGCWAWRCPGVPVPRGGTQLALPLEPHDAPELRALGAWERMLADYGSTGVTLREHPLELMRPSLPRRPAHERASSSATRHGRPVRVAGLVVARQRPATAKGVTFMLLEDEHGTINLIVPPPVHERCRLAVRAEPLRAGRGRLERREGTMNVVVDRIERLERPDLPRAEVRHIEPRRTWSTEPRRRRTCARSCRRRTASARARLAQRGTSGASLRRLDRPDLLQRQSSGPTPSNSRAPPPSTSGDDVQLELVDEAGRQVLVDAVGAAADRDVLAGRPPPAPARGPTRSRR